MTKLTAPPPSFLQVRRRSLLTVIVIGITAVAIVMVLSRGSGPAGPTNLDLVTTQLEDRVREDPQNPDARSALAIAYAERGLTKEAATQFKETLVLRPDDQTALIGLGQAQFTLKDYKGAEESLGRVVQLNEKNERRYSIEQLAGVYFDLARISVIAGDPTTARSRLDEALKITKTDSDTWHEYGKVLEKLGDDAGAERAYFTALRFVPDYTDVYVALESMYKRTGAKGQQLYASGMIQLSKRQPAKAVKDLESAVTAVPDMAQAHEGLAIAYEGVGRKDEALAEYRKAIALAPDLFLSGMAISRLTGS